ncbi:response regulator [bacterium]|nr:response regulator [bacterium]
MKNILIIDDHDFLLHALELALEDEYTVYAAQSGEEALGLMEVLWPDLVITDLNMPGMSGLELIKRINLGGVNLDVDPAKKPQNNSNANPQGGHRGPSLQRIRPKIILYTAMLTPGLIAYAQGLGVAACLPKPFELGKLKNLIKRILSVDCGD